MPPTARPPFAVALALLAASAAAQLPPQEEELPITLGDLRTPVETLTREQVEKVMVGADVMRLTPRGLPQRWKNRPDGTLEAASTNRQGRPFTEFGEWRVNEAGQYCVSIAWHFDEPELWCRHVVKNRDGYYIATGLALTDVVRKYEVKAAP